MCVAFEIKKQEKTYNKNEKYCRFIARNILRNRVREIVGKNFNLKI